MPVLSEPKPPFPVIYHPSQPSRLLILVLGFAILFSAALSLIFTRKRFISPSPPISADSGKPYPAALPSAKFIKSSFPTPLAHSSLPNPLSISSLPAMSQQPPSLNQNNSSPPAPTLATAFPLTTISATAFEPAPAMDPPPRRRSYTKSISRSNTIGNDEIMVVSGEIVEGEGWRRHTRVFGGGVCMACVESERRLSA